MSRRHTTKASAEFGRRLRARREQLGLTQEKLAHRVDMTYSFISDMERGRANPTFDTILKMAQALDEMDAGELVRDLRPEA